MAFKLAPMSEEDFQRFLNKSMQEYAYNQTVVGNWLPQNAVAFAREEQSQMLPDGLNTPNAFLSNVMDENDQKIGMMWFFLDEDRPQKTVVLLDFFLFPAFRGKGFEADVLKTFEEGIKSIGVKRIELQVFGHKTDEVQMYMDNAYKQTMVLFGKNLEG
jgi:GNAT superfamily N-acetyltransferase